MASNQLRQVVSHFHGIVMKYWSKNTFFCLIVHPRHVSSSNSLPGSLFLHGNTLQHHMSQCSSVCSTKRDHYDTMALQILQHMWTNTQKERSLAWALMCIVCAMLYPVDEMRIWGRYILSLPHRLWSECVLHWALLMLH